MIWRCTGFVAATIFVAVIFVGCNKPAPVVHPSPTPTPTPAPTPTPIPTIPRKPLPTAKLFNGLSLEAKVVTENSLDLASRDRGEADAYQVEITVRARLPKASSSLEEFSKNDPSLPEVFKDFPTLLSAAKVSPFFKKFYSLKVTQIQRDLGRLDHILSRHNFYDCETILEFTHPITGRKGLFVIGDMDVNVDGSDGDRNVAVDGSSPFFLPQTSYRWRKQTERVNPFVSLEEQRLTSLKAELNGEKLTSSRAQELNDETALVQRRLVDLKKWSFLISEVDPFIVLPGFMMREKGLPFTPRIGDFALVIYAGHAYPAIVGDAGPSLKIGEASLLLCRELNARSSAGVRPVSDLKVAYLIFPGTADEMAEPPNLEAWRKRCEQYVNELGGLSVDVHTWPDLVKPWPTPTPEPTPSPTPDAASPTPVPSMPLVVTPGGTN